MSLIAAMIPVHKYIHRGIASAGSSFIKQTTTKKQSAAESNFAPASLVEFVRRAIHPSSTSDVPAMIYQV